MEKSKADQIRDKIQKEGYEKWVANNGSGIFEWATGSGKTRLATHYAIKDMNKFHPERTVKVVVPRSFLKDDWEDKKEGHIKKNNLKNVDVWVVNSFVKFRHTCDLLVLDECHRYSNEESKDFKRVFEVCKFKFIMLLTATLSNDQRMFLHNLGIKTISTLSTTEAESLGIISPYIIYNIGLELTNTDKLIERDAHENFIKYSGKFNRDMNLAIDCVSSLNPRYNIDGKWYDPPAVKYAREQGWNGIELSKGVQNYLKKKNTPRGHKGQVSIWEDEKTDFEFTPTRIQGYARQYIKYMNLRKDFLHNAENKLTTAIEIVKKYNLPTILFSERTTFADKITELLGDKCASYHSNLESRPISNGMGGYITYKSGTRKGMVKLFGAETLKKKAIDDFNSGNIIALSTAVSLDEGFNVEKAQIAIICSGTGVKRQMIQRIGRVIRAIEGKVALIINLYIKDTQDEKWLKERLRGNKKPIWIESINELPDVRELSTNLINEEFDFFE